MFDSFRGTWKSQIARLSRRQWLRRSGALAVLGSLDRREVAASPAGPALRAGDTMSGELDMGEYLMAGWTARRHRYGCA